MAKAAKSATILKAYCMATKEKNVPMKGASIEQRGNRFMARGNDGKGHNMCAVISKETADAAVAAGEAKITVIKDEKKKAAKK